MCVECRSRWDPMSIETSKTDQEDVKFWWEDDQIPSKSILVSDR
jgi:hypothetical protein